MFENVALQAMSLPMVLSARFATEIRTILRFLSTSKPFEASFGADTGPRPIHFHSKTPRT